MRRYVTCSCVLLTASFVTALTARVLAENPILDFGAFVAGQLSAHSEELFGFTHPLTESALGPFNDPDNVQAIQLADGLQATLVSSSVASAADQIALWPNDDNPTHLFVCDEETSIPAVQRVDLSLPPGSNATTIVTGLTSCDPVRRTPWGTILVAEEATVQGNSGVATGGVYEILDPVHINTPINVTNRTTGANTDSLHLAKRQAVGTLSFESFAIKDDGTMIYGDELAPGAVAMGSAGGGIYKFVPSTPFQGASPITVLAQSPLVSGTIYGLRVAASGPSSNWGQGAETGKGRWIAVNLGGLGVMDGNGNFLLRVAQVLQQFTGYYRPEDMDIDPVALENGVFRACWANTGRMSHTDSSLIENSGVKTEIMCLTEEPTSISQQHPTGTIPAVDRFITGSEERGMFDNVAFQPHTGNLVVLEDNSVNSVKSLNPTVTELRGNDLWICLPDGADDDVLSDGCVRFGSIRDTSAEPSGFIFLGSGEEAFVSVQHRAVNDSLGVGSHGALLKISGFKVKK